VAGAASREARTGAPPADVIWWWRGDRQTPERISEVVSSLRLTREWTIGERIGDTAGFGRVHAASSPEFPAAVVKFVPKAPGAERELLFADDLAGARNVVPVIDSGETAEDWVLVMPRAERSLLAHLKMADAPLALAEALTILSDVATALSDLDGRVVHRDMKPANVLLLNGTWCVADFGISRYAEATTAPDTRKFAWTPAYAAPEQWRGERASSATDVYAFGVMAHELVAGEPPFGGPAVHDYREQHLHAAPPSLAGPPAAIAALIEECFVQGAGGPPDGCQRTCPSDTGRCRNGTCRRFGRDAGGKPSRSRPPKRCRPCCISITFGSRPPLRPG
jgi:eukaryotic-like serine/threonine-protein kinase